MKKLTVLSFGGGQDSTAILYKLIDDQEFRIRYAPDDLLVVMADTGNEHEETYQHCKEVEQLCKDHGIPFFLIEPNQGYNAPSWNKGLIPFYEGNDTIGSKAFPKTCTVNLKITPIYNFINEWVHVNYNTTKLSRKGAIKEFVEKNCKIDVLIGIARDEEKRASTNEQSTEIWMRKNINKVYPLLEIGMNRQDCQDFIKASGRITPAPSNCILCPFMSKKELLYLYRALPEWFDKWVEMENNKIQKNKDAENNLGVWGNKKLLPEILKEAEEEFGHMTIEELKEYKFSHGHCVMSKY